jgi:hypothetical protein
MCLDKFSWALSWNHLRYSCLSHISNSLFEDFFIRMGCLCTQTPAHIWSSSVYTSAGDQAKCPSSLHMRNCSGADWSCRPMHFLFLTSSHFTCVLGYICCHRDVMVIIRLPHCYSLIESYIVKYYLSSMCAGWWRIIWKFHKRTGWYLVLSCKACKSKFSSSLHILGMCVITSTFNLEFSPITCFAS